MDAIYAIPNGRSRRPSTPLRKNKWRKNNNNNQCCIIDGRSDLLRSAKHPADVALHFGVGRAWVTNIMNTMKPYGGSSELSIEREGNKKTDGKMSKENAAGFDVGAEIKYHCDTTRAITERGDKDHDYSNY